MPYVQIIDNNGRDSAASSRLKLWEMRSTVASPDGTQERDNNGTDAPKQSENHDNDD